MRKLILFLLLFSTGLQLEAQVVVKGKAKRAPIPIPKPQTRTIVVTKQVPDSTPAKSQGVVLIESNMDALVYVNGVNMGKAVANIPKKLWVDFGDNAINVVSIDGNYSDKKYHTCEASKQVILTFDLQSKKAAAEQAQREETVRQEQIRNDELYKHTFAKDKKIDWVSIPSGTFAMGSPADETERKPNEVQHQVTLSSFKMSKYEVTFAQYDAFCEAIGRTKPNDEGWGRGNRPVINVNWEDANAFAQWMGCRLPTEAEWEYACRAGTTSTFYSGDSLTNANFNNINNKTMPVGSYPANAWGLHDMHGNVWEWCSDWYNKSYYNISPSMNPQGPASGFYRVFRGGSWLNDADFCRSAYRNDCGPGNLNNRIGFRLVAP